MTGQSTTAGGFNSNIQLPQYTTNGVMISLEGNHNVPQSWFLVPRTTQLDPFFGKLKETGWFDAKDFAQNGSPLPGTKSAAAVIGSAYHAGHGIYTEWAAKVLDLSESERQHVGRNSLPTGCAGMRVGGNEFRHRHRVLGRLQVPRG